MWIHSYRETGMLLTRSDFCNVWVKACNFATWCRLRHFALSDFSYSSLKKEVRKRAEHIANIREFLGPMGIHGVPLCPWGPWDSMGPMGPPWAQGTPWGPMGFHATAWVLWGPMGLYGSPGTPMGPWGVLAPILASACTGTSI